MLLSLDQQGENKVESTSISSSTRTSQNRAENPTCPRREKGFLKTGRSAGFPSLHLLVALGLVFASSPLSELLSSYFVSNYFSVSYNLQKNISQSSLALVLWVFLAVLVTQLAILWLWMYRWSECRWVRHHHHHHHPPLGWTATACRTRQLCGVSSSVIEGLSSSKCRKRRILNKRKLFLESKHTTLKPKFDAFVCACYIKAVSLGYVRYGRSNCGPQILSVRLPSYKCSYKVAQGKILLHFSVIFA